MALKHVPNPLKKAKQIFGSHEDQGNGWESRQGMKEYNGSISICILEANNLIKADLVGSSDPYAVVHLDTPPGKPESVYTTENVSATPTFQLTCDRSHVIVFDLMDKDTLKGDDALGSLIIELDKLDGRGQIDEWFELQKPSNMSKRWLGEKLRAGAMGVAHTVTLGAVNNERKYGNIRLQLNLSATGSAGAPPPVAGYEDDEFSSSSTHSSEGGDFHGVNDTFQGHDSTVTGHHCVIQGHNNTIRGHHNTIMGHDCTIIGKHNDITGDRATVKGSHNTITGNDGQIWGKGNKANGSGHEFHGKHKGKGKRGRRGSRGGSGSSS